MDPPRTFEVEAKAPAPDLRRVEAAVAKLGGVLEANKVERDEYFAHPSRNFASTDEALRLRVTTADDGGGWSRAQLTYKGPKVDPATKTRAEETVEVAVDEVERMRWILQALGFKPVAKVLKSRREFELEGLTICLDDVEGVGTFVEVELMAPEVDAARARVLSMMSRLGLEGSERRSYLELLLERQKGH